MKKMKIPSFLTTRDKQKDREGEKEKNRYGDTQRDKQIWRE